jgi:D-glycero-alpha-D-manno-heptose 1-phosphate guanylyltransferase
MEAIILAGGFGSRLREMVPDLPKPMAPVAGRPFLEILLLFLSHKGFTRVILSLGFMAFKISNYFGKSFAGMDLVYVVEDSPLGTGGAVRLALSISEESHVFTFNGDTFLDLEVDEIEQLWKNNGHPIIVGHKVQDTARYGRLLTKDNYVTGLVEKGISGPGLVNAGCYIFNKTQFDCFQMNEAFSLETDFLTGLVARNKVNVFVTEGLFIDIGIPRDYTLAQTLLSSLKLKTYFNHLD